MKGTILLASGLQGRPEVPDTGLQLRPPSRMRGGSAHGNAKLPIDFFGSLYYTTRLDRNYKAANPGL